MNIIFQLKPYIFSIKIFQTWSRFPFEGSKSERFILKLTNFKKFDESFIVLIYK